MRKKKKGGLSYVIMSNPSARKMMHHMAKHTSSHYIHFQIKYVRYALLE